MKFIYKLCLALSLFLVVSSCQNLTDLDLLDNPNAVTPDKASLDDLYNNILLTFGGFYGGTVNIPSSLTRQIMTTGGYTYANAFQPTAYNGLWNNFYAGLLPDVDALLAIAQDRGLNIYAGTAKLMKAYCMIAMVDLFGDIPYSEAGLGTDVISPTADSGQSVYNAALALIDEAITQLTGATSAKPANDEFYNGNPAAWITMGKTLKLKALMSSRLVNTSAASEINALISGGDLIDQNSENFEVPFGTQRTNPNSRHPWYNNAYETTDATYQHNYFMWLLHNDKEDVVDPRIRFYFYRQIDDVTDRSPNEFSCIYISTPPQVDTEAPAHYLDVDPNMPFCAAVADQGYYGRDHLNNQGIPPDGPTRTVYGLYPAGGNFDDNSFDFTQNSGTDGALGEGIWPILMAFHTDFWLAEAALTLGTTGDPKAYLESGVRKSIARVKAFASKVDLSNVVATDAGTGEEITAEEAFLPTDEYIDEYVAAVLAMYDAASSDDARLNVIMKEFYISLYGNGMEAYNNYRRTCMPLKMQPGIDPAYGNFTRSFYYPSVYVDRNANATQKESNTVPVFWDTKAAGCAY